MCLVLEARYDYLILSVICNLIYKVSAIIKVFYIFIKLHLNAMLILMNFVMIVL